MPSAFLADKKDKKKKLLKEKLTAWNRALILHLERKDWRAFSARRQVMCLVIESLSDSLKCARLSACQDVVIRTSSKNFHYACCAHTVVPTCRKAHMHKHTHKPFEILWVFLWVVFFFFFCSSFATACPLLRRSLLKTPCLTLKCHPTFRWFTPGPQMEAALSPLSASF